MYVHFINDLGWFCISHMSGYLYVCVCDNKHSQHVLMFWTVLWFRFITTIGIKIEIPISKYILYTLSYVLMYIY